MQMSRAELMRAGQSLLDLIKKLPHGEQHVQIAYGATLPKLTVEAQPQSILRDRRARHG